MTNRICPLCRGAGSQVAFRNGQRQFWTCQACGGDGSVEAFGPPTLAIGPAQARFMTPETTARQQTSGEGANRFSVAALGDRATMAHIAVAVGIFPSLSQARKNGFDQPLTIGSHFLTKKRIPVEIII